MASSSSSTQPSLTNTEDGSLSDSMGAPEDEKTIPFLRRLRDMLLENGDAISFVPGDRSDGKLGRIIVHDRIRVERKVLPKYFNHSSFASLRRQLNYFSFVRVGKGRQRESTYVNESVTDLKDILHLKRRSAGNTVSPVVGVEESSEATKQRVARGELHSTVNTGVPKVSNRVKRRRLNKVTATPLPQMFSAIHHVSEDERSEERQYLALALDLTKPTAKKATADDDILAGCNALLELAGHGWR